MTVAEGAPMMRGIDTTRPLQWGRNLTVAEGDDFGACLRCGYQLQWGRNLTVAEGIAPAGHCAAAHCFNGAAT